MNGLSNRLHALLFILLLGVCYARNMDGYTHGFLIFLRSVKGMLCLVIGLLGDYLVISGFPDSK